MRSKRVRVSRRGGNVHVDGSGTVDVILAEIAPSVWTRRANTMTVRDGRGKSAGQHDPSFVHRRSVRQRWVVAVGLRAPQRNVSFGEGHAVCCDRVFARETCTKKGGEKRA